MVRASSAIDPTTALPATNATGRPTVSTSTPPSAMPVPRPLTMNAEDQVKASVAYRAGARRDTRTDGAATAGAMRAPAKNATTANAAGGPTTAWRSTGTAINPIAHASWRSTGALRCTPPKIAPPSALPSEFTDSSTPANGAMASAVAYAG